jgi:hypothetical protein
MISDELAQLLAASIARHQSRGLVDDATGLADVVIHGRVDMLAVADEVLEAARRAEQPGHASWSAWFACRVEGRRKADRQQRTREKLLEQLESAPSEAEAALARLRVRDLESAPTPTR